MALTTRPNLIKSLQTAFPRGRPFNQHELATLGVSSALAHHYLKSGWLGRLGRGVFMFPNDTLRREDCLRFLSGRVPGFHVGGKTALAWRGIRHNLPAREPLSLWREGRTRLQDWFLKPRGYADIVELSEEEFRKHARLDEPAVRVVEEFA